MAAAAEGLIHMAYLHYAFPAASFEKVRSTRALVDQYMHVTRIQDVLGRRLLWMNDVGSLLGLLSEIHVDDLTLAIFWWAFDTFYNDEVLLTRRAIMVHNWEKLSLQVFNLIRNSKADFKGHGRANFMDAYKKGKYPFVFDCIWIFNAPWYVRQGWALMRFLLNERTHKMYTFLQPSEYKTVMANFRDPAELPEDWPVKPGMAY